MSNIKSKIKEELIGLFEEAAFLHNYISLIEGLFSLDVAERVRNEESFKAATKTDFVLSSKYQKWYSKASVAIKQLLPDRFEEFKRLYIIEKRENKPITNATYTISDYLLNLKVHHKWGEEMVYESKVAANKIEQQVAIIESCISMVDSRLLNIESILQSELFEDELRTAKTILKGSPRVAGALAGITLEAHLKKVCENHSLIISKKHPTISDFNETLRKNDIIETLTWRLIQRLGDIRNLCVHAKEREPSKEEVQDLIIGCDKLISELI